MNTSIESAPPGTGDAPTRDMSARTFAVLGVALFLTACVLRHSYANYDRLTDGDQSCIATGAVSLERGVTSRLYNYPEQLGYYELARAVHHLLPGGDLTRIRTIMVAFSVVSGSLLVGLALLAFPAWLSRRVRLLFALSLLCSPVLWRLSQYGNTALLSGTLAFAAFVIAGRGAGWKSAALAALPLLYAHLVRKDAILVAPAFAWFLWKRPGGRWWHGLFAVVGTGGAMVIAKAVTEWRHLGAALSDSVLEVVFNSKWEGHFVNFFYWGQGPTLLLFAAIGWRELGRIPGLRSTIALIAVAPFLFYLPWATTPRYTMLLVVPVTVCAGFGVFATLQAIWRQHALIRLPLVLVTFAVLLVHMVFVLDGAMPAGRPNEKLTWWDEWTRPRTYQGGDGPNFHGALLMQYAGQGVPARFYPRDSAGRDLARLARENSDRAEHWLVVGTFWDDIYATAFYLISQPDVAYHEFENYTFRFGKLTIEIIYQGFEQVGRNSDLGRRATERVRGMDRVFRELAIKPEDDNLTQRARAAFPKLEVRPTSPDSELFELILNAPRDSRPASRH